MYILRLRIGNLLQGERDGAPDIPKLGKSIAYLWVTDRNHQKSSKIIKNIQNHQKIIKNRKPAGRVHFSEILHICINPQAGSNLRVPELGKSRVYP